MSFVPKSEETRKAIIKATAGIFNKKGYVGTYVSDLLKATNLTKGGIYGNFENKEDIAHAAFDYNVANIRAARKTKVDAATTWQAKLLVHIDIFSSRSEIKFPEGGCPLGNTALEADDTDEVLRKKVAGAFKEWENDLIEIMQQGIAAGEFKKDTNVESIARQLITISEGAIMLGQVHRSHDYLDGMLEVAKGVVASIINNKKR